MANFSLSFPKNFFRNILDFFYPPICVGCEKEIEGWGGGFALLCPHCYEKVFTSALASCPKCHRPVPYFRKCKECKIKLNLERIRALGLYAPPFPGIIEEFKYKEKTKLAEVLGDALSLLLAYDPILREGECLIPIPLHPAKMRERGYNQSELLAHQIEMRTHIPVCPCLRRIRNTKSQTELSKEERFRNMEKAFGFREGYEVKGKKVILVDDVMTTGATLNAAASVLKEKGAKEVYGIVACKG